MPGSASPLSPPHRGPLDTERGVGEVTLSRHPGANHALIPAACRQVPASTLKDARGDGRERKQDPLAGVRSRARPYSRCGRARSVGAECECAAHLARRRPPRGRVSQRERRDRGGRCRARTRPAVPGAQSAPAADSRLGLVHAHAEVGAIRGDKLIAEANERELEAPLRQTRQLAAVDPTTRQVLVFVSIPNASNKLVAGLFAEGRVSTESRRALEVPVDAVDQSGVTPMVTRIARGKAERVTVQFGVRD